MENSKIHVAVEDHVRGIKTNVAIPNNVSVTRLVPALVSSLGLATEQNGQPIVYHLDVRREGTEYERIAEDLTLESANVQDGATLRLFPEITAGMLSPQARIMRLEADYEEVVEMHELGGLFSLIAVRGDPPEYYRVRYTCKGIDHLNFAKQPVLREEHQLELTLGATYPADKPFLHWLTPIFNPNIHPSGHPVCIGEWGPAISLADLLQKIGEMIQYRNYATA
ncbi:MAG: hypothetical protein IPK17_17575 [Chloroflexi bacterium]|uniref:EsaB/YukD family protein n=1 Tax=Candidatus Flexifilum breve TaxID=3140694 RepID=UPI003135FBF9|nr:hypothetical protein [Chloroflexota bacterium]